MEGLKDHSARSHALLSASSAHRWLACPPSAIAAEAYPKLDTEFTKEGTLAHEIAELVARNTIQVKTGRDGFNPEIPQEMIDCAGEYSDYIEGLRSCDDWLRLFEQRVDFSPWVPDGFGTADCILIQGDTMDVIDYKYGKGVAVSAEANPQEMLYGLGALNDYGFAYNIKKVRLHIFQPRINNISVCEMTTDELTEWGEKTVKPTAEKAIQGKGKYKAGEHCRFCPHAGKCRALTKLCTEYINVNGEKRDVQILAPWEVSDILHMEPMISLWLKRVKDQALTSLLNGDSIPGYKVVEGKMGNRKWSDELKVSETLQANGYSLQDITETKLLSPASMDKAIGKKKVAEILTDLIDRSPGAPTVVPESDKRPAYDRVAEAVKDFE